jgi:hypothetical protein
MTAPFDASLIDQEPVDAEVMARHRREVESCMTMQSAMANAKLHAENELQRLVALCNRLAWGGGTPYAPDAPDAAGVASVLERLSPDDQARLLKEAKAAKEQRALVREMHQAEALMQLRLQTEQIESARLEAEQRDWAEFLPIDQAEQRSRFEAWRAARGRT